MPSVFDGMALTRPYLADLIQSKLWWRQTFGLVWPLSAVNGCSEFARGLHALWQVIRGALSCSRTVRSSESMSQLPPTARYRDPRQSQQQQQQVAWSLPTTVLLGPPSPPSLPSPPSPTSPLLCRKSRDDTPAHALRLVRIHTRTLVAFQKTLRLYTLSPFRYRRSKHGSSSPPVSQHSSTTFCRST